MKILHLITALNVGGAETMLAKLLEEERRQRPGLDSQVLSLTPPGPAGQRIQAAGIGVSHCGLVGWSTALGGMSRLVAEIRRASPDVVVAWMYHAHLSAAAAKVIGRCRAPVVWNVRHSLHDLKRERPVTRGLLRMGAWLSGAPDAILYNSAVAARQYEGLGHRPDRTVVIPNGFDCARFRPQPELRSTVGAAIGARPTSLLVGMVARQHPMKDHGALVRACAEAIARGADLHLLLVGQGLTSPSDSLMSALRTLAPDRVSLKDHEPDIAGLLPGLDVLALSSAWGEGFPNILGEAMACGLPCIATDVGDSRQVLGEAGIIVPPENLPALTEALIRMERLSAAGRHAIGRKARDRVQALFSIEEVTRRYHCLLEEVASGRFSPATTLAASSHPALAG
ncbi:glycosyltransferase [Sphingomonas arenae]|uniref:glycosyltransferase n=1 Tax=Sphingomonas arenae TaxID=2812555 RepID=UPI0019681565|nr:glycosyltransferase [Sphingomonas arenae]